MTAAVTTEFTTNFTATCHVCGVLTQYADGYRVDSRCEHKIGVVYADAKPTDADLDELLDMSERHFRQVTADDVRGQALPRHAAALRHDEILDRWSDALLRLTFDLDAQLSEKKNDRDPETRAWRRAAMRFRGGVMVHREECKRLLKDRNIAEHEERNELARARREARPPIHVPAAERALERLVAAHRAEMSRYLIEEHEMDGLPLKDRWIAEAGGAS